MVPSLSGEVMQMPRVGAHIFRQGRAAGAAPTAFPARFGAMRSVGIGQTRRRFDA
jgi:hypothetical protein